MPKLPDIPGKDLIAGTTKRARTIVVAAGTGALAVGGIVAKRAPSFAPPSLKPNAAPKPKAAPEAAKPEPGAEPVDQRGGKVPHHALDNPVGDPDETEYPDPCDKGEGSVDPPYSEKLDDQAARFVIAPRVRVRTARHRQRL